MKAPASIVKRLLKTHATRESAKLSAELWRAATQARPSDRNPRAQAKLPQESSLTKQHCPRPNKLQRQCSAKAQLSLHRQTRPRWRIRKFGGRFLRGGAGGTEFCSRYFYVSVLHISHFLHTWPESTKTQTPTDGGTDGVHV